ncbi:hypothetical protein TYRP_016859 [Tyrophagus putrescentiae]|nr:hypothetical protein TYRP_016859 [Tyrophagus putrescentiae]
MPAEALPALPAAAATTSAAAATTSADVATSPAVTANTSPAHDPASAANAFATDQATPARAIDHVFVAKAPDPATVAYAPDPATVAYAPDPATVAYAPDPATVAKTPDIATVAKNPDPATVAYAPDPATVVHAPDPTTAAPALDPATKASTIDLMTYATATDPATIDTANNQATTNPATDPATIAPATAFAIAALANSPATRALATTIVAIATNPTTQALATAIAAFATNPAFTALVSATAAFAIDSASNAPNKNPSAIAASVCATDIFASAPTTATDAFALATATCEPAFITTVAASAKIAPAIITPVSITTTPDIIAPISTAFRASTIAPTDVADTRAPATFATVTDPAIFAPCNSALNPVSAIAPSIIVSASIAMTPTYVAPINVAPTIVAPTKVALFNVASPNVAPTYVAPTIVAPTNVIPSNAVSSMNFLLPDETVMTTVAALGKTANYTNVASDAMKTTAGAITPIVHDATTAPDASTARDANTAALSDKNVTTAPDAQTCNVTPTACDALDTTTARDAPDALNALTSLTDAVFTFNSSSNITPAARQNIVNPVFLVAFAYVACPPVDNASDVLLTAATAESCPALTTFAAPHIDAVANSQPNLDDSDTQQTAIAPAPTPDKLKTLAATHFEKNLSFAPTTTFPVHNDAKSPINCISPDDTGANIEVDTGVDTRADTAPNYFAEPTNNQPASFTSNEQPPTKDANPHVRHADVRLAAVSKRAKLSVKFTVRDQTLSGILDSGANVNLMPYKTAKKLRLTHYPYDYKINQLMGSVTIRHIAKAKITIGKITDYVTFLLYDHPSAVILGLDIILKFQLRMDYFELKQFDLSATEYTLQLFSQQKGKSAVEPVTSTLPKVAKLIEKNQPVPCEYNKRCGENSGGRCHVHQNIATPVTLHPYRTTPHIYNTTPPLQQNINSKAKEFPAEHLIAPFTSPYVFPVVMVDKGTDEKKFCLCDNPTKLNEKSVMYLKYKIEKNALKPFNSNCEVIVKLPPPTDLKSLCGFLRLLRKTYPWKGKEEEQTALDRAKQFLTSDPTLHLSNIIFQLNELTQVKPVILKYDIPSIISPAKCLLDMITCFILVVVFTTKDNLSLQTLTPYPPACLLADADKDCLNVEETPEESRHRAVEKLLNHHQLNAASSSKRKIDSDANEEDEANVQLMHKLNRHTLEPPFKRACPVVPQTGFVTCKVIGERKTEPFHLSSLKVIKKTSKLKRPATTILAALVFLGLPLLTPLSTKPPANATLADPDNLAPANNSAAVTNFAFAPPLVWSETNPVASIENNFLRHTAILFSPCTPLHLFINRLDEDMHKCRSYSMIRVLNDKIAFDQNCEEKVLTTIQLYCHSSQLPICQTSFVSYCLLTVQNSFEEYFCATNIHELSALMHKTVSQIENQNWLNHTFQSKLLVALDSIWKEIDSLRLDLENDVTSVRLLAVAKNPISETTNDLELLFDEFKEKKISSAYAHLFLDSSLLREEPSAYLMAKKCHCQKPNTLNMDFDVPVINSNKFTMLTEKTNCTNDASHLATEDRAVAFIPSGKYSCNLHPKSTFRWNLMKCEEEINNDRPIQYTFKCDDLYHHCYLHRLNIANRPQIHCSNAVLRLDEHQQFAKDVRRYVTNSQTFIAHSRFGYLVSDLINNRSFTLSDDDQRNLKYLPAINYAEKKFNSRLAFPGVEAPNHLLPITARLIAVIAFLIIFVCLCYCHTQFNQICRYNLHRRRQQQPDVVHFKNSSAETKLNPVLPTGEKLNTTAQSCHFRPDVVLVSEV